MSENLQIVSMIIGFLTPPMGVLVIWMMMKIKQAQEENKKEIQTVAVDGKATKEAVVRQGELLVETTIVATEAKKQADGLTAMVAAAKLNEGISKGELKERDRAEAKAEAILIVEKTESVTAIRADLAEVPKKVVDEIDKREK